MSRLAAVVTRVEARLASRLREPARTEALDALADALLQELREEEEEDPFFGGAARAGAGGADGAAPSGTGASPSGTVAVDHPLLRRAALRDALARGDEALALRVFALMDDGEVGAVAGAVLAAPGAVREALLLQRPPIVKVFLHAAARGETHCDPALEGACVAALAVAAAGLGKRGDVKAAAVLIAAVVPCFGDDGVPAASARALVEGACSVVVDREEGSKRDSDRAFAMQALVSLRGSLEMNDGAVWNALRAVFVRPSMMMPESQALRRRALRVMEAVAADEAWKAWAAAYACAEFETSAHLLAQNAYGCIRVAFRTLEPGWAQVLVARCLASNNPAVRKLTLGQVLRYDFFEKTALRRLDWPWVRDVIFSALDDAMVRRARQVASELDILALAFAEAFWDQAAAETRLEIARFATSDLLLSSDLAFGNAARFAWVQALASSSSADGAGVAFTTDDVFRAADALIQVRRLRNRAVAAHAARGAVRLARTSTAPISTTAVARLCGVAFSLDVAAAEEAVNSADVRAWLRSRRAADDDGMVPFLHEALGGKSTDVDAVAAVAWAFLPDDSRAAKALAASLVERSEARRALVAVATRCATAEERASLWHAAYPHALAAMQQQIGDMSSSSDHLLFEALHRLRRAWPAPLVAEAVKVKGRLGRALGLGLEKRLGGGLEEDPDEAAERCLASLVWCVANVAEAAFRTEVVDLARRAVARARASKNTKEKKKTGSRRMSTTQAVARFEELKWSVVAQLRDDAVAVVDADEVIDALDRCGTSKPLLIAVFQSSFSVIVMNEKNVVSDGDLARLLTAAWAAFEDYDRVATPAVTAALLTYILTPAIKRVLLLADADAAAPAPEEASLTGAGAVVRDLCERLFHMSAKRTHLGRAVAFACCAALSHSAEARHLGDGRSSSQAPGALVFAQKRGLAPARNWVGFAEFFAELVVFREPSMRLEETPDDIGDFEVMDDPDSGFGVRFHALATLDRLGSHHHPTLAAFVDKVCVLLLARDASLRRETRRAAASKSAAWGKRLRLWQALGVLAPKVSTDQSAVISQQAAAIVPHALTTPASPCVRYAIEVAAIVFARRSSEALVRTLVETCDAVRDGTFDVDLDGALFDNIAPDARNAAQGCGRELALASILAVAAHAVVDDFDHHSGGASLSLSFPGQAHVALQPRVLASALSLLTSTRGLVRGVAQVVAFRLRAEIGDSLLFLDQQGPSFLRATFATLTADPDVVKNLDRQRAFFTTLRKPSLATLRGLLAANQSKDGFDEGIGAGPDSLIAAVRHDINEANAAAALLEMESGIALLWHDEIHEEERKEDEAGPKDATMMKMMTALAPRSEAPGGRFVQRKIDHLMTEEAAPKLLMPLIVCASLVDKATNLGGLARTVEIFGAEQLVVGNKRLCKTHEFQVVAASAEKWVDIVEVKPAHLGNWLRLQKIGGYAIVALEQATDSLSLADATVLPTPAVLVLGAEREGVPVELLELVDHCVEIPQTGKVRSLNVHVSAALTIFHFAKQTILANKVPPPTTTTRAPAA